MSMASSSTKALVAVLLILTLVHQGYCACSLNDVVVGTNRTGNTVQGKTEWKVTITNNCNCTQSFIRLSCDGFQTVEPVDVNVLEKKGDKCLVTRGNALNGFSTVTFVYAWDTPFVLIPIGSVVDTC